MSDTAAAQLRLEPICEEKNRLLSEYTVATEHFAERLNELHARIGTSTKAEYESLRNSAEEARLASERARRALEHHVAWHGC